MKKLVCKSFLKDQSQLLILMLLVLVFSLISPSFRSSGNFVNLLKQITVIGTISFGMTIVVITGCLDLSVGSTFSLLSLIAILCQQKSNVLALVVPLLLAVCICLFNGFIVTKFKLNSIIVTLGSLSLLSGVALLITNGSIIAGRTETWYGVLGRGKFLSIPNHVYLLVIVGFAYQFSLGKTAFGRKLRYVGVNEEAAEIAGIKVCWVRTMAFIISSVSVAISVFIYTSRMTTASPIIGTGFEFDAITAVVIGGTSLDGGHGSIFRTIVGVLLLATIINVLTLYNIPFAYQSIVKGILIILSIMIDKQARK